MGFFLVVCVREQGTTSGASTLVGILVSKNDQLHCSEWDGTAFRRELLINAHAFGNGSAALLMFQSVGSLSCHCGIEGCLSVALVE